MLVAINRKEQIEQDILALVASGKTKQALKQLRHLVDDDEDLKDEWINAHSRWERISNAYLRGQVSYEDTFAQKTTFNSYLIGFVKEVVLELDGENRYTQSLFSGFQDKDDFFHVYSNLKTPGDVWAGFVDRFKSYNDPWLMEYICPEDYLDTHRERYNDPNCGEYNFQFFPGSEGNSESWKPFIRFAKFQMMVHFNLKPFEIAEAGFKQKLKEISLRTLPDTLRHLKVFLNFSESPRQTFFRGYKYKNGDSTQIERVSIWYLMLDEQDELPALILKSSNEDFWMDLDKKWNASRKRAVVYNPTRFLRKLLELPDEYFEHEFLID